jgi:hypothetical protein
MRDVSFFTKLLAMKSSGVSPQIVVQSVNQKGRRGHIPTINEGLDGFEAGMPSTELMARIWWQWRTTKGSANRVRNPGHDRLSGTA